MSSEEGLEDRTEEATQQRRDEWRKEGRVSQSKEFAGAMVLLVVTGVIYVSSEWMLKGLWNLFQGTWGEMAFWSRQEWSAATVLSFAGFSFRVMLYVLTPLLAAAAVVGAGMSLAQIGFIWTSKPLELDLNKINPLNGLKRIFGADGLVELLKAVVKFSIAGAVVYYFLRRVLFKAGVLWDVEARGVMAYMGWNLIMILASVTLAMFVIAAFDFGWQRFRHDQKMRMTKQEVKEERRQMEGNPHIKARVKSLQRRIATTKMVEAVAAADVVVTNPTHIAIALMFDRDNMHAPKVVAKGADFMAERIKKIARENGVPCVENVPLARAMYKALKIGQFISRDLYNAVAEVLAYVYRLKGRTVS